MTFLGVQCPRHVDMWFPMLLHSKLLHLFPLATENNAPSLMDLHGPMCVCASWTHFLNDPKGGQF